MEKSILTKKERRKLKRERRKMKYTIIRQSEEYIKIVEEEYNKDRKKV
jgi:hypothetical protein